jgi:alkylation response protein AidB-like acyl-CoA dehydrogenase
LLLARTNPDVVKHLGITAFLVDMHAPGVEIRPLRQMSGAAEFNEVFFSDVRIPDSNRVEAEGKGWTVAVTTLMNERVSIGGVVEPRNSGPIGQALQVWEQYRGRADAAATGADAHPDADTAARKDQLMKLWVEAEVLRLGNIRAQARRELGTPGPEGSVLKLGGALLGQRIAHFTVSTMGPDGMLHRGYDRGSDERDPITALLGQQANTIAGGTSEVMRNILGERVLGLPPEPRVDRDVPWSQIPKGV